MKTITLSILLLATVATAQTNTPAPLSNTNVMFTLSNTNAATIINTLIAVGATNAVAITPENLQYWYQNRNANGDYSTIACTMINGIRVTQFFTIAKDREAQVFQALAGVIPSPAPITVASMVKNEGFRKPDGTFRTQIWVK